MTLRNYFEKYPEPTYVDFCHWDEEFDDDDVPTCVDFSLNDFTEYGLKHFEDVLNAEVEAVQEQGEAWVSIALSGCAVSKIRKLARFHAGYCKTFVYDQLFKETE